MGFYMTLCTFLTTQGQEQRQEQGTIVFYRARPGPGPTQCVRSITPQFGNNSSEELVTLIARVVINIPHC